MRQEPELVPEDHVIVVFGANGDLARRKLLPAFYHLAEEGLLPRNYRIIGNSRSDLADDEFRKLARDAVDEFCRCEATHDTWEEFSSRLAYVSHEFEPGSTKALEKAVLDAEDRLGSPARRLFYLAVPPVAFAPITRGLDACDLTERARVIYEKPFGIDASSFRELDGVVHDVLDESQIYRIDHFLGKETVQNIMALRFANGMFEPVWNRNHIHHAQIDVPEDLGIGTRAGFYEKIGAFRDMIVTHLFQVLSVVAMEPPATLSPKALIDEKVKVFQSMRTMQPEDVVRGQYEGYLDAEGVAPGSDTETFVAARVFVDNWRWAGVPFYLRTGKRMAVDRSSITLAFQDPPREMFRGVPASRFDRGRITIDIGPHEGISATFLAKAPGPSIELMPARMEFRFAESFGSELLEAYERLLHDALLGDRTLFTRADGIGRVWDLVRPVLADAPPLHAYPQGSWGPKEADELLAPEQWHLSDPDLGLGWR